MGCGDRMHEPGPRAGRLRFCAYVKQNSNDGNAVFYECRLTSQQELQTVVLYDTIEEEFNVDSKAEYTA